MPSPCEKQLDGEMLELLKAPFHLLFFFLTSCRTNFIHCSFDLKMPASGVSLKSVIEGATLGKAFCLKCLLVPLSLQSCRQDGESAPPSTNSIPLPPSAAGSCPSVGRPLLLGPLRRQQGSGGHVT